MKAYKDWGVVAARYKLTDFGSGTFAYKFVGQAETGEPDHLACPTCFQLKKRSLLQFGFKSEGKRYFDCNECGKRYRLET